MTLSVGYDFLVAICDFGKVIISAYFVFFFFKTMFDYKFFEQLLKIVFNKNMRNVRTTQTHSVAQGMDYIIHKK